MWNQEMEPMNVYGADYNHPLPNLLILTYKPFTPFADYNWSVYIYVYLSFCWFLYLPYCWFQLKH